MASRDVLAEMEEATLSLDEVIRLADSELSQQSMRKNHHQQSLAGASPTPGMTSRPTSVANSHSSSAAQSGAIINR